MRQNLNAPQVEGTLQEGTLRCRTLTWDIGESGPRFLFTAKQSSPFFPSSVLLYLVESGETQL